MIRLGLRGQYATRDVFDTRPLPRRRFTPTTKDARYQTDDVYVDPRARG